MIRKDYQTLQIVIADDHELFRDGFRAMLKKFPEINLAGEAENGQELIELVNKIRPDVVLTDIQMPIMNGIDATRAILKDFSDTGVIALTMFNEENLIIDMLEAGAKGYLLKNTNKDEIVDAIYTVSRGNNYYCNETSSKLIGLIAQSRFNPYKKTPKPVFTSREIEIIKLICDQFSNKEIANQLKLSVRTIEGYREKIQEKTNSRNSAGIVVFAIKNNLFKV